MSEKYLLRHDDITDEIGILTVDFSNDVFTLQRNDKYDGPIPFFLQYPNAPMPCTERIKMWILGRAPEPNAEFINALIKKAGLKEYDAYGFFKFNNGRFITDKFYVEAL